MSDNTNSARTDLPTDWLTSRLGERRLILLLGFLLVFANVLVFSQVITFEFLMWDDEMFVLPIVNTYGGLSWQSVSWAFTNHENGWRTPVSYLSLFLDTSLFGINPAGYHLSNLFIHTASSVLLFVTLRRMTRHVWTSALAAAIFAVHPLHVEPVAWVTGRWELLCGFFWIAGLWSYVIYCGKRTWPRYLLVWLAYVLAILSKPMALTFPFVLILLDYWPLRRVFGMPAEGDAGHKPAGVTWRWAIVEKVPLLITMIVLGGFATASKRAYMAGRALESFSLWDRVANILDTYVTFAAQTFWPQGLSFFYPHPALFETASYGQVILCAAVLIAVTSIALINARRHQFLVVGWLWYLGVLVPAIGILQVENHARADRYTYIPLIGLSLAICWSIRALAMRLRSWPRLAVGVSLAAAVVLLAQQASQQAHRWRDNQTLFQYAVKVDPRNYKAWQNLSILALRAKDYRLAERYARHAAAVLPASARYQHSLANTLFHQGRFDEAEPIFRRALEINPGYTRSRKRLADIYAKRGDMEKAEKQHRIMVEVNPGDPLAHRYMAGFLAVQQNWDEAIVHYREAIRLNPFDDTMYRRLGNLLENCGRYSEAIDFYAETWQKHPHRLEMANNLAWLLATHPEPEKRDPARAIQIAEHLCELAGYQNRFVLDTLAAAYAAGGRFDEAVRIARRSLHLATAQHDSEHVEAVREYLVKYESGETHTVSPPPLPPPHETAVMNADDEGESLQ